MHPDMPPFARHDADRAVVFEDGELHLVDALEAVLAKGRGEVLVIEAFTLELGSHPGAVAGDGRRRDVEKPPHERGSSAPERDEAIGSEQGQEDEDGPRQGRVRPGDRRLEGIGREEHRRQIEQRELAELAFPRHTQGHEEDDVDHEASDDEFERRGAELPGRIRQVEHPGIVAQRRVGRRHPGKTTAAVAGRYSRAMSYELRRVREDDLPSWFECVATAFLDRPDTTLIASQIVPHWDLDRVWGAFDGPAVGTFRTWASELTVPGGARLPASAVTAVTVRPTHRRRGILRAMVAAEHDASRERGEQISMLYAAEAPIYGRFGYGPGVKTCSWTLDVAGTGFVGPPARGIDFLPIDESTRDLMRDLHEQYRVGRVGEVRRRPFTFGLDLGLIDFAWEPKWKGWVLVHRTTAGEPDGYVRYGAESKWEQGQPRSVVKIQDLIALSDEAYDAFWRFLADTDLVSSVSMERGALDDRLPWLLTNSRAAEASGVGDSLWVNLLDVSCALAARTYELTADIVLEVVDPERGGRPARVHLNASPDGVTCLATKRPPDLTIHAGALGAAYLGGTPLRNAVIGAGFDEHRAGALVKADALFRTLEPPRCTTFF